MNVHISVILALFLLLSSCCAIDSNAEVSPLGISKSGHYFQYDGKNIMLVGDSGTQCVMQNANIDYRRWIDECNQVGINSIHIWSFMAPRQRADGSVLEKRYGYLYPSLMPWARKTTGPRAYDGYYQWDLNAWDEGVTPSHYWPRLRDLCAYAKQMNIIVGITVFWGWPKHRADWLWHPFNSINGGPVTEEIETHATKVQHIATPGVEILTNPWGDNWTDDRKNQWLWEMYAEKMIKETNHYGNVFYVFMDEHSYDEGNGGDHFRQFFQNRGALWVDWEARRSDVNAVCEQVRYDNKTGRNKGGVAGFKKSPAKPFMMLEWPPYSGDKVRYATWTFLVAGGHHFFHDDERQETPYTGIMGYDPRVPDEDNGEQNRIWNGYAGRFFNVFVEEIDSMTPDNSLVDDGDFCLADSGREYVIYSMPGEEKSVHLNLTGEKEEFIYSFYNPRTGQLNKYKTILGGGWIEIDKPTGEDWAVHISRKR